MFTRRAFGVSLAAFVAVPKRLSAPGDLKSALEKAGFTGVFVGESEDRVYVWSRVSRFCADGHERHSLIRKYDVRLASLTRADVDEIVREHRQIWDRGARNRLANGLIPRRDI